MAEEKKKKKKKGGFGTWMYRIVMLLLLCVIGFSGYKVYTIWDEYHSGTVAYDDLARIAGAVEEKAKPGAGKKDKDEKPARLKIDWEALQEQGPGVKGWLRSVGTSINYPGVQGSDNDYYLRHIMTGEYSNKGSLFIDYRCPAPFEDFLTIIYGHRMMDDTMFNSLGNYFEKKDYFKKHAVVELYTPDGDYDLQIFGAANVNAKDYSIYNFELYDETSQQAYIDWILEHNELLNYDDSVKVKPGDRIVMLSTCTYDPGDDRIVVWAKMVPVKEKKDN